MKSANKVCIVLVGATASGKSGLAIELAKRLGFEIINADAIQVYAGLPIATAKVSTEEMKGIPHHFLGVVKPPETITVGQFQRQVHAKIEELFCKPECNGVIIVGGTTYYIEGLLFKNQLVGSLMEHQVGAGAGTERAPPSSSSRPCTIATEESSAELHERLAVLDPEAAAHLHPNNRRKVLRALQIIEEAGPKGLPPTLSALHALQSGLQSGECMGDGNPKDHTLHYPNSLVVHVSVEAADAALLESRISGRVDQMVAMGLEAEVRLFYEQYYLPHAEANSPAMESPLERGIYQAIGFKEFLGYLRGEQTLEEGAERLKTATSRYAKRQIKWLTHRLFPQCLRLGVPVLDISSVGMQQVGSVEQSAAALLPHVAAALPDASFTGVPLGGAEEQGSVHEWLKIVTRDPAKCGATAQLSAKEVQEQHSALKRRIFTCETCNSRAFQGQEQFDLHLASGGHKKAKSAQAKRAKNDAARALAAVDPSKREI